MSLFAKLSTYDERSARLAGIGLMLLSIFMFSFGDALGKFMVATYSVGQLLWLRACAALLVAVTVTGGPVLVAVAAGVHLVGAIGVTAAVNVPMNDALARSDADLFNHDGSAV